MRFAYFFLVEWGNMWVMSAICVTAFLGGWQVPGLTAAELDALLGWPALIAEVVSLAIFVLKTLTLVFVVMWLRWTLPRVRIDQVMLLCWKFFLPIAMGCVVWRSEERRVGKEC